MEAEGPRLLEAGVVGVGAWSDSLLTNDSLVTAYIPCQARSSGGWGHCAGWLPPRPASTSRT